MAANTIWSFSSVGTLGSFGTLEAIFILLNVVQAYNRKRTGGPFIDSLTDSVLATNIVKLSNLAHVLLQLRQILILLLLGLETSCTYQKLLLLTTYMHIYFILHADVHALKLHVLNHYGYDKITANTPHSLNLNMYLTSTLSITGRISSLLTFAISAPCWKASLSGPIEASFTRFFMSDPE